MSLAAADAFMSIFGMKRVRLSKCKVCHSEFQKRSMTHKCCTPECAQEYAKREREKKDRKETRTKLSALKTRSQWLKEAERACNAYIRERDRDLPCVSCGNIGGDRHAGHFRSVGSSQALRFYEFNIASQCSKCNLHLAGNLIGYRIGLTEREGNDLVEYLSNHRGQAKWTIEELKEIKDYYKAKLKSLMGAKC